MSEFRKFLNESTNEINTLQSTLKRRFGAELGEKGWVGGSKGTGIVAMVDTEDGSYQDGVDCVNKFLKLNELPLLKRGRVSGELVADYRGATLSVIETADTYKVMITK